MSEGVFVIGGRGKNYNYAKSLMLARALLETRPANVPLPFWFDFSKKMDATLGDVLEKLASYMNTPDIANFKKERREAGQNDINRLTGELQKREPVWLVFDNLEIILDGRYFHDQGIDSLFTSLRDSTHQAKVIVTSRTLPLLGNGESLIDIIEEEKQELKGLKITCAVDYLIKNGLDRVEREQLEELANGIDGHPLALRLLIELVKKFGVSDTLNDLRMYQRRRESTIKKARRLFDKLAGDEKELLECVSVYRQPEPMTAIKTMFTAKTSVDAVEKLIDESLLETDHKGNYWLHPLVREFAYDDLENKIEAHKVAVQYYRSQPLPEERGEKVDVQSLIEACHHACMVGDYDMAAGIIFDNELHEDLDRWGNYTTLIELYEKLLPERFDDEPKLTSIQTHGAILGNLGLAYAYQGQVERAIEYYEQALAISKEIGDRCGEGTVLGNFGLAYAYQGQVERAIKYHEQALAISKEIGDRCGEGRRFGNLGEDYYAQGQVKRAIEYYEQALAISKGTGDREGESAWLGNLGLAYFDQGQVERAIKYHEQALAISKEIGDRRGEGRRFGNLGEDYYVQGQVERAIDYYEQALAISKEIGDREGESAWLGNLGLAYSDLGQVERAIKYHEQALAISKEIGDRRGEGHALGNLGLAYSDLGQVERAIGYYEQALAIAKEIGDRRGEGADLGNLGRAYFDLGQVERAIGYYEQALAIAMEIGDRHREGAWLNNLGVAFKVLENYDVALACYLLARKIRREIRDPKIETPENNISGLKNKMGKRKFQKLRDTVESKADEIIQGILAG